MKCSWCDGDIEIGQAYVSDGDGKNHHGFGDACVPNLRRRIAELARPPEVDDWKALVEAAYLNNADGARRIERITSHYNWMRDECVRLQSIIESVKPALQAATDVVSRPWGTAGLTEQEHYERIGCLKVLRESLLQVKP